MSDRARVPTGGAKEPNKPKGVRALTSALKIFALLDIIAQQSGPVRLSELTRLTGEGRGTIYQRLVTLLEAGWLDQPEPGLYRLALHSAYIGGAALEQASLGERCTIAMQDLVLELGETVSLAVLDGVQVRLVKRVEAEVVVRAQLRVGSSLSLASSSSGRVLTAFADPAYLAMLRARGVEFASDTTLAEVRRTGHGVSAGRDVPGVRSVAVPVFSAKRSCIAALSVVSPEARFDRERFLGPLRACGEAVSGQLAFPNAVAS